VRSCTYSGQVSRFIIYLPERDIVFRRRGRQYIAYFTQHGDASGDQGRGKSQEISYELICINTEGYTLGMEIWPTGRSW
jgi:hypothetical protein